MGHKREILTGLKEDFRDAYVRGLVRTRRVYSLCSRRSLKENCYETLALGKRGVMGCVKLTKNIYEGARQFVREELPAIEPEEEYENDSEEKFDFGGLAHLVFYLGKPKNREELIKNINYISSMAM